MTLKEREIKKESQMLSKVPVKMKVKTPKKERTNQLLHQSNFTRRQTPSQALNL